MAPTGPRQPEIQRAIFHVPVIPGHREAMSPESITTIVSMGDALRAALHDALADITGYKAEPAPADEEEVDEGESASPAS